MNKQNLRGNDVPTGCPSFSPADMAAHIRQNCKLRMDKKVIIPAFSGVAFFSGYPDTSDGIMHYCGRLHWVN